VLKHVPENLNETDLSDEHDDHVRSVENNEDEAGQENQADLDGPPVAVLVLKPRAGEDPATYENTCQQGQKRE
jgi:hypothetical protein